MCGRGLREEGRALEVGRDRGQLGHRLVRGVELAARDGDLHARGKQARSCESVPRLRIECLRDDRRGCGALPLRQPDEREPWLGTSRQCFGLTKRALRARQVSEAAAELSELDVARRRMHRTHLAELRTRARDLLLRARPVAPRLQRPRVMHAAHPREEDRVRMTFGPPRGRLGPLSRTSVVADLLARADEAAVHLARRIGAQPSLDREQHGFVELLEAVARAAAIDQDASERLLGLGLEVGAAQLERELECAVGLDDRLVELAPPVHHLDLPDDEVAVLDARAFVVEPLSRPAQPRTGDRGLRPERVVLVEPHGALPGATLIAGGLVDRVRRLTRGDAVVHAAQPPRGVGPHVEPRGVDAGISGDRVVARALVRGEPVVASQGGAGLVQAHAATVAGWHELPIWPARRNERIDRCGARPAKHTIPHNDSHLTRGRST